MSDVRAGRDVAGSVALAAVVAFAAVPIVLAAWALVGDPFVPVGDWASAVLRTGQVGTGATPLVGAYSTKGWAHPGPLPFWVAAPLYRLTGGDPRSLLWTAAAVNVGSVVALAAVARRRGGWALLTATMLLVALLVHGLGPSRLVDMWNPYVPLLPFLLTIFLVWDAGLGRSRALVEAVVPASFAAQSHVAFVSLLAVVVLWFVLWRRFASRISSGPDDPAPSVAPVSVDVGEAEGAVGPVATDGPAAPAAPAGWRRRGVQASVVLAVLWVGPVLDLLFDLRNPIAVVRSFADGEGRMGPSYAFRLLSRYVRPDGPWIGGAEPTVFATVQGSGPVWLALVVVALAGCLVVARRRGLVDVLALATLALALLAGAIPAVSRFEFPANVWLAQWIKIVGGLVWFTLGWTGWRLVEPVARSTEVHRRAAGAVVGAALAAASVSAWGNALAVTPPYAGDGAHLGVLERAIDDELPRGPAYRLEASGDLGSQMLGLVGWMVDAGYDVETSDGASGLKWGHAQRWERGDEFDVFLTLAVHEDGQAEDAFADCLAAPGTRLVAQVDELSFSERAWLDDLRFRRVMDPPSVTRADDRRAERLEDDDFRAGVFAGPGLCSDVVQPSRE